MQMSDLITVVVATLVLMIAGGLIAYLGDRWGYSLGKKRLSLFGMRPRKTASFLTVVAGVFIAILTFGVLLAVSANFRMALIHGATLRHNNKILTARNKASLQEASQNRVIADRYKALEENEASKEKDTEANLATTQTSLNKSKSDLINRQAELQTIDKQLQVADNRLIQEHQRVAALKVREQQIAQVAKDLAGDVHSRMKNRVIYANNAEVGRTVVASAQSEKEIRSDLIDFLGNLSDKAKGAGASAGAGGRCVEVASIRIGSSPIFAQESDSINVLADQIHAQGGGSVVVIAYAVGNAFANKPVDIGLKPFVNKLVIPAGTILGQTVIPGQQKGVAEILSDMQAFLSGPVHREALHRGVIPIMPADDIGGVGARQIDPAVAQIQQISGDAQVVALAAKDTYAADQVSLDFVVRSAHAMPVSAQSTRP